MDKFRQFGSVTGSRWFRRIDFSYPDGIRSSSKNIGDYEIAAFA